MRFEGGEDELFRQLTLVVLEDRGAFHVTSDGTETEVIIARADDDAVVVGGGVIKPRLEGLDEGGN